MGTHDTPNPGQERDARICALLPLARRIATRLSTRFRAQRLDDMISDGYLGVVLAVDSFDPSYGVPLEAWAAQRVRSTIFNGIRSMDIVPESVRRKVRCVEDDRFALAQERHELPTIGEMDRRWQGFERAYARLQRFPPLSLDASLPDGEREVLDFTEDPAAIFESAEGQAQLHKALERLARRERDLIDAHYFKDTSLRSFARSAGISNQRASQLHRRAIARLRLDVAS